MTLTKSCDNCGQVFEAARTTRRWCSKSCQKKFFYARDRAVPWQHKVCSCCGKRYQTKQPVQRWCSLRCRRLGSYQQRKERIRRTNVAWRKRLRQEVIALLGGACAGCGETDLRVLQVNHLDGGGTPEIRQGVGFYRSIRTGKRSPQDLDVRCANCNILYEYERGARL